MGVIWVVLNECMFMSDMFSFVEYSCGGVVDFEDECDLERLVFGVDGSFDGGLLLGVNYRCEILYWLLCGDDGWYLEDYC